MKKVIIKDASGRKLLTVTDRNYEGIKIDHHCSKDYRVVVIDEKGDTLKSKTKFFASAKTVFFKNICRTGYSVFRVVN